MSSRTLHTGVPTLPCILLAPQLDAFAREVLCLRDPGELLSGSVAAHAALIAGSPVTSVREAAAALRAAAAELAAAGSGAVSARMLVNYWWQVGRPVLAWGRRCWSSAQHSLRAAGMRCAPFVW